MSKNKNILLISILFILLIGNIYARPKMPIDKIEKFSLSAFTRTVDGNDSLEVLIYMEIPYSSLQFIKRDSTYIANYESTIALQTKKGNQLFREIWQDSIVVNNYNYTVSTTLSRTLMLTYTISGGKYKVIGNLLDLDTKKDYKNNIKIDVSKYDEDNFINQPILLEPFDGDWGFGEDLIPAVKNRGFNFDERLMFYLSGKIKKGKYIIENKFSDQKGKVFYTDTITDSSDSGFFSHLVKLPIDSMRGLSIKLESNLIKDKSSMKQSTVIALKKAGISQMVQDVDKALDQMSYILKSKERKMIRKTSLSKREELLKKLWKERDPTPDTEKNELMDEYYKRVEYANMHFETHMEGWRTDMGRIYILFGPPDEIQKYVDIYQYNYETWYYYRINESYTFVSDLFGNFSLVNQYLSY